MKKVVLSGFMILLLAHSSTQAKEIHIHFPYFTGQKYDWKIFQGGNEVTINSGKIPLDGRVTLVMPDTHKNYRGMTRWMLKRGGGLDMIYMGYGFSVECLSENPNSKNIVYTNNPENDYLSKQGQRQQTILKKLAAVNHLLQAYTPDENLHKNIFKEQKRLHHQFEQIQLSRSSSPLYAARFGEIVDFTRGIADKIYENPEDHTAYFNDFVTYTLNFDDLYTSGHWDQVWHHWLMMNIHADELKDRLDTALKRMELDKILTAFAEKSVPILVKMGKDDLLPRIASHLDKHPSSRTGLPDSVQHMLASFKLLTGTKAPDLIFRAPVRDQNGVINKDIILKTSNLYADYTILLFYQGDCQSCEDALITLANQYKSLKDKNVRVIGISADENEQSFEKKLPYHQWPDTYCDFSGMSGTNFKNYAVLGTPTLYLLDRKGIVLRKTALVEDLLGIIDTR